MRSNGLTAASYTPVADLTPQVADALLDDLRERGVAAYTTPVESSTAAGFDRPEYRLGVRDRLYVDTDASEVVRAILVEHDPDLAVVSEDLAWEQIVASFDLPTGEVGSWPADEDLMPGDELVDERDTATPDEPEAGPRLRWGSKASGEHTSDDEDFLAATHPGRDSRDDDRDDPERFVPPTPPPLPKLAPYQQLAWVGLIGGPLLLLIGALFSLPLPRIVIGVAIVGFIGGFVTLVATMGNGRDDDWDPDNGAVV